MLATILLSTLLTAVPLTLAAPQNGAVPGQILGVERHDLCPKGWKYRVIGACASGYVGCAKPEDIETCTGGPDGKAKYKPGDCVRPEYGTYQACPSNGFYGCSNNPSVCQELGPKPPPQPIPGVERYDLCPPGWQWVAPGACPSGFVGCSRPNDAEVCAGMPVFATCNRPEYGTYKTCKNGFFGCTPQDWDPCTKDAEKEKEKSTNPKCPAGTTYFARGKCESGFTGCAGSEMCTGPKRFWWGDCPAGTGVFNVCGNKFEGCTTVPNPCDL